MQARTSVTRGWLLVLLGCASLTSGFCPSAVLADGVPESVSKIGRVLEHKLRPKKRVYAYTDNRGRLVYAERLEQVPTDLQKYSREMDAPEGMFDDGDDEELTTDLFSFGDDKRREGLATIYRLTAPDGSTVYTNLVERVPVAQRASAAMDLSHISLNTELGNELDKRIKEEHARLIGSKYCQELRAELDAPLAERMWRDERPLLVCLAFVLLFLLITPSMVRKVGGPAWGRTLTMAVPSLVIADLVMFGMTKASSTLGDLKHKAEPCQPGTWDKLAEKPDTGLSNHLNLVQSLQQQIKTLDKIGAEGK